MLIYGISHRGCKRRSNQDRFSYRRLENGSLFMAVADGMGGEAGGEVAAQTAMDALTAFDPHYAPVEKGLESLIREADGRVRKEAEKNPRLKGMGTTLTMVVVRGKVAYWAHLGDSRLYLFRQGELTSVTQDHTVSGFLLAEGKITREEARVHPMRSGLLDCVGCGSLDMDSGKFGVSDEDLLMLTTDGLHDHVPEETIRAILGSNNGLEERFQGLVNAALAAGGLDNVTVVGVQL